MRLNILKIILTINKTKKKRAKKDIRDLENANLPIIVSSCSNPNLWGFLYEDFDPYPQCCLDGNGRSHFAISWACAVAIPAAGNG